MMESMFSLQEAPQSLSLHPLSGTFHFLVCMLRAVCVLVPSTGVFAIKIVNPRCQQEFPVLWEPSGISSNLLAPLVGACSSWTRLEHGHVCLLSFSREVLHRYHPVTGAVLPH